MREGEPETFPGEVARRSVIPSCAHRRIVDAALRLGPHASRVEPAAVRNVKRARWFARRAGLAGNSPFLEAWDSGEQGPRVGMTRRLEDRVGLPFLDDAAQVHDGDPVAYVADRGEIVSDEDERQPETLFQTDQ